MEAKVTWLKDKMKLIGESRNFQTFMDSKPPFGDDTAATPKELVLQGLCGCTAMDVIALLKKHKQPLEHLEVRASTDLTKQHPTVFTDIYIEYHITGPQNLEQVKEIVSLSRHKFCGVIAMLEKNSTIHYSIFLNGNKINLS